MNNQKKSKINENYEIMGEYSIEEPKSAEGAVKGTDTFGDVSGGADAANGIDTGNANGKGTQKVIEGTNGITPAKEDNKSDTMSPLYDEESDSYAVRQSLENAGITDIEWDDGKVVSHGVSLVPFVNRDGTTYAKKSEIHNYINRVKEAQGDPLVRVNSYNNKYGMTNLLDYDEANKRMTVDGNEVDYAYIDDDGNAWASKQALDFAYDVAAKRRNIKSADELISEYKEKVSDVTSKRRGIVDEVKNWDFTYEDLKNDPVYNAYKEMYRKDGIRAYNDTINDMAARNGGNLSGSAIQAAGANYNRYMEKMNNVVPQIADMAYNRFMKGQQYDYNDTDKIEQDAYKLFSMGHNASRDAITDQQRTAEDSYNRFVRDSQLEALNDNNSFTKAYNDVRLESARQAYETSRVKAALEEAKALGYYTDNTASVLGISTDANGNYPSVNSAEINRELELYNNVDLPRYTTEMEIKRDYATEELERKLSLSFWDMVLREQYKRNGFVPGTVDYYNMINEMR